MGGGYVTHLTRRTNILLSCCFNDWRFADLAKPSNGNCAFRSQTCEAFALEWLVVDRGSLLAARYLQATAGRGPAKGARVKATVVGIKDLQGSGLHFPRCPTFWQVLPSPTPPTPTSVTSKFFDPHLTITKPHRIQPRGGRAWCGVETGFHRCLHEQQFYITDGSKKRRAEWPVEVPIMGHMFLFPLNLTQEVKGRPWSFLGWLVMCSYRQQYGDALPLQKW